MYFTDKELQCRCGCGSLALHNLFFDKLEQLRIVYDRPMIVNSCCRCDAHNRTIGGASNSYHLMDSDKDERTGALAIDIKMNNSIDRASLVGSALALNWSVIIYDNFVHLDRRVDLGRKQVLLNG